MKQEKYTLWATQNKEDLEWITTYPSRDKARQGKMEAERIVKVEVKVLK